MTKIFDRPVIIVLFLLILSGYLYFFQLDKIALTDPDETFYAQTAKEMVKRGEWLTPILYGKSQFEKPILFYWLVEASYRIFGINEFAARFP
ncbi:MAG: glycosyltransferase family 39 protein, partial [Candidatus Omnitrophica bacterium]|nr:glycosyltransferase family 39 protein [Candidatus Omnitrophota bacterium]